MVEDDGDEEAPICAGPDPHPRRPGILLPPLACDCHVHLIGPVARFPLDRERRFTPPDAPLGRYRRLMEALGLERAVLVQPSVYGTDHECMLQALAQHRNSLRGIARADPDIAEEELERIAHTGVRGLRFNLLYTPEINLAPIEALARRIEPLGWHIELLLDIRVLPGLARRLAALPVPVVFDHMGHMPTAAGARNPGFQALLGLLRDGVCWVKLSGASRISSAGQPWHDTLAFARTLVETDPTRLLWGSDWPHFALDGPVPNDGDLVDLLAFWVPEERLRHLILVENPARLYRFGE